MPAERHVHRPAGGERASRRLGPEIAELSGQQYGVLTRAQLRGLGATDDVIDGWLSCRWLLSLHRGVFVAGHRLLTVEGRWMAAVLAGGRQATLSIRAAGDHWGLTGLARPTADVTVPGRRRPRPGIRWHVGSLLADEVTVHEGIPVTTVARTLLDLAAVESSARLRHAIAIAESRRLADATPLPALIERYPRRPGAGAARAALAAVSCDSGVAWSELELRFAEFLDARGFPRPERNAPVQVGGRVVYADCLWRDAGLAVELDSRAHHADWESAEADRARDAALLAIGIRTVRVTARRLRAEGRRLELELRAARGEV